jgi:hypothetical protein
LGASASGFGAGALATVSVLGAACGAALGRRRLLRGSLGNDLRSGRGRRLRLGLLVLRLLRLRLLHAAAEGVAERRADARPRSRCRA